MPEAIEVTATFPASPERIFRAWLDSEGHGALTGAEAKVSDEIGESFQAWDGYISGKNVILEPHRRIVQSWRTTEFPQGSPDSHLEVILEELDGETRLTLRHTEIPDGQGEMYKQGWFDYYFEPMKRYFAGDMK